MEPSAESPPVFLVCAACGRVADGDPEGASTVPCTLPAHRWLREIDPRRVRFPELGPTEPFARFRTLLSTYQHALDSGVSDAEFLDLLEDLAEDPPGAPKPAPFVRVDLLHPRLESSGQAAIWVKDVRDERLAQRRGFARALVREVDPDGSDTVAATREAGVTLAFELVSDWRKRQLTFDRVLLSLDDPGLAAGIVQGLREAVLLGVLPGLPRLHLVGSEPAPPFFIWLDETVQRILGLIHPGLIEPRILTAMERHLTVRAHVGDWFVQGLRGAAQGPTRAAIETVLAAVSREPLPAAPDPAQPEAWLVLARGIVESGGFGLSVPASVLEEALGIMKRTLGDPVTAVQALPVAAILQLRAGEDCGDERVSLVIC